MISISIVSHCQFQLVCKVLEDLARIPVPLDIEILVTINVPEIVHIDGAGFPWPIKFIRNVTPKGFGANHNAAFQIASGSMFCVMNPDIRLYENPFPPLLDGLANHQAALITPAVQNPNGKLEDSIRRFPSPMALVRKLLGRSDGRYPMAIGDDTFEVDWAAGMFMLFRGADYRAVGGFDESFFLYYEDVDICTRLWKAGLPVLVCPKTYVVHDARRESHKNFRYMNWHLTSMVRYFLKHWGRIPRRGAS